jgi:hypothetical protein
VGKQLRGEEQPQVGFLEILLPLGSQDQGLSNGGKSIVTG